MRSLYAIPRKSRKPRQHAQTHAALWMDKLCPNWEVDQSSGDRPVLRDRLGWCESFTEHPHGDADALTDHTQRLLEHITARRGVLLEVRTASSVIVTLSPDARGGLPFDHTLGAPVLPASMLKGLARDWARTWIGAADDEIQRVFGAQDHPAGVAFLEGIPAEPVPLEVDVVAPHYAQYYDLRESLVEASLPGDWQEPDVEHFLVIPEGVSFIIGMLPLHSACAGETVERAAWWLGEAMTMIGVGARTSSGYGRMAVTHRQHLGA